MCRVSITKPEPVACCAACAGNRSNGILDLLDDLRADEDDAGRVALVDVVRGQPGARRSTAGWAATGDLLDDRLRARGARSRRAPAARRRRRPRRAARRGEMTSGSATSSATQSVGARGEVRAKGSFARVMPAQRAARRASMSPARISASPTSTASTPTRSSSSSCRAAAKPDSDTTVVPVGHVGQQLVRALDVDGEVAQVAVVDADDLGAERRARRSSSRSSWTSTSTSSPSARAALVQRRRARLGRARRRSAASRRRRPPRPRELVGGRR